jgi:SAM-dependent methyltransferase
MHNSQFDFLAIDAQKLPFPSEYFDGVIANHVLFHVPDLEDALAEIRRVLRVGGQFYASTIGIEHHQELHELLAWFSGRTQINEAEIPSTFTLENGTDHLSRFFSQVKLHRYEDSLLVTEAEPLIAYVESMMTEDSAIATDDKKIKEFAQFIQAELDRNQKICITKEQGLFSAIRKDNA